MSPALPRRTAASDRDNDIDLEPDELGRDLGVALAASLRPAILDRDGAALDPAEFAQPLHKSGGPLAPGRRRGRAQEPDGRQLPRLLRARRERPSGRRAAEKRDELAPSSLDLVALRLRTTRYHIGWKREWRCASQQIWSPPMSEMGHKPRRRSGPGASDVRSTSNRVGILCTAAKDAKCQEETYAPQQDTAIRGRRQTPKGFQSALVTLNAFFFEALNERNHFTLFHVGHLELRRVAAACSRNTFQSLSLMRMPL